MTETYETFKNRISSEKLSLVIIYPRQNINTFDSVSTNIWKTSVTNVISKLYSNSTQLEINSTNSVTSENPWFYDIETNELYYYSTSDSPDDDNLIAEYMLHFSNAPINLSYNLEDYNEEVTYEPRLLKTVGFKSEIGSDQKGISVTGSGSIVLQNNDGYFDSLFDSFVWENKRVEVYSYGRNLSPSEAKLQYKGYIVNKAFNLDNVSFKIQDSIFKLDTKVPMNLFTADDGVNSLYVGQPKRQIYGKLEGLLCRSIDQVSDGYLLEGTVSGAASSQTLTGVGTSFLSMLAQGDTIIINSEEYSIDTISSDTSLTISDTDGFLSTFVDEDLRTVPFISNPEFNRSFFVADHAISRSNTTLTNMTQLNRFEVENIQGFEVGDTITVNGDSFTIFNISGNQIQTSINADDLFPIDSPVIKEPITQIFLDGKQVVISDLESVSNSTECTFMLSNTAEFNIAKNIPIDDANFTFTNGSRIVSYSGGIDLTNIFQVRDWIKSSLEADSTFMRIVSVTSSTIECSTTYSGTTGSSKKATKRRPNYISDDSNVSINCLGRTEDGTATGSLISTGADVVKQLLIDLDLESELDLESFTKASTDNDMRVSIAIPYSIEDQAPKVKSLINDINQSIFGSLSLKQNLTLAYLISSPERTEDIRVISDDDIIGWSMKGMETNSYKRVLGRYKFKDFDRDKEGSSSSLIDYSSSRVSNYDISNKEIDFNFRVFEENDALELSERFIHYNEQTLLQLKVESDLRLSDVEIGDNVKVKFQRFINQPSIGDSQRVLSVVGIKKDGNSVELTLSDLGNLFNRSAVISNESALDYADADADERRLTSYITDDNGLITSYRDSKATNLIS